MSTQYRKNFRVQFSAPLAEWSSALLLNAHSSSHNWRGRIRPQACKKVASDLVVAFFGYYSFHHRYKIASQGLATIY